MNEYMKNFDLTGKVALVTGASYGIGFAIAKALSAAGATICFNDLKQEFVDKGLAAYDAEGIKAHLSAYLEALRNAPKADGQTRIYTHGEKEVEAQARLMAEGIPVNDNTMVEVLELCNYLNLDFSKYFGDYMPETGGSFKGNFY